ncbi:MAG: VOC family protein [Nocardioidaceae bacterium]
MVNRSLRSPHGHRLLFIEVPEPKTGKNRVHLDLRPRELTRDAEVECLVGLGARVVADRRDIHGPGVGWVTMTDPEGTSSACCAPSRSARHADHRTARATLHHSQRSTRALRVFTGTTSSTWRRTRTATAATAPRACRCRGRLRASGRSRAELGPPGFDGRVACHHRGEASQTRARTVLTCLTPSPSLR